MQHTSVAKGSVATAMPIILAILDLTMIVVHMNIASMEVSMSHLLQRKKQRLGVDVDGIGAYDLAFFRHDADDETLPHPHDKQILDLVA
jgi:hypothetical protein